MVKVKKSSVVLNGRPFGYIAEKKGQPAAEEAAGAEYTNISCIYTLY